MAPSRELPTLSHGKVELFGGAGSVPFHPLTVRPACGPWGVMKDLWPLWGRWAVS